MMNNPTSNTDEKKCEYCGFKESSLTVNEEGNMYQRRTKILTKRIVGYEENVTEVFCIWKPVL